MAEVSVCLVRMSRATTTEISMSKSCYRSDLGRHAVARYAYQYRLIATAGGLGVARDDEQRGEMVVIGKGTRQYNICANCMFISREERQTRSCSAWARGRIWPHASPGVSRPQLITKLTSAESVPSLSREYRLAAPLVAPLVLPR